MASGGKDYIGFLVDAVPTAANIEYHAQIVREKAILRRLIEVSTTIVAEAFDGEHHGARAARRRRVEDLPGQPAADEGRLHAHQGAALADDGAHRGAPARRQDDHRRRERLQRSRRDDVGLPAGGSDHRRGASVDGKDGVHAQHRAARGDRAQAFRSRSSRWK